MLNAFQKKRNRCSFVGKLSGFVIVTTKVNRFDIGVIPDHLPQHMVRHATGCGIAVLFPTVFMHGNKGQHIYWSFKNKQLVA